MVNSKIQIVQNTMWIVEFVMHLVKVSVLFIISIFITVPIVNWCMSIIFFSNQKWIIEQINKLFDT